MCNALCKIYTHFSAHAPYNQLHIHESRYEISYATCQRHATSCYSMMPDGVLRSDALQCSKGFPHCKEYACVSRYGTLCWSSDDCIIVSHTLNMCAMRCYNLHILSKLDWHLPLAKYTLACHIMVRCLQSCTCCIAIYISYTKHLCHAMSQPLLSIRRQSEIHLQARYWQPSYGHAAAILILQHSDL